MVGKTFKGLTDELLRWQTDALQAIALGTEGHTVHVRPELVVEIALDGVQRSTRYPGGVALRFARVRRYRPDKSASEADTIESVQRLAVALDDRRCTLELGERRTKRRRRSKPGALACTAGMATLRFSFGTMGSGKSTLALQIHHNLRAASSTGSSSPVSIVRVTR